MVAPPCCWRLWGLKSIMGSVAPNPLSADVIEAGALPVIGPDLVTTLMTARRRVRFRRRRSLWRRETPATTSLENWYGMR